jgi:predicted dehydrogenase
MERRDFLAGAAMAAAPLFVPQSAFGANDRISYGVIATGGRGRYVSSEFTKLGAECVAICDVYEPNLLKAKDQHPQAKTFVDYHDLLAEKMDAVLLAGPDHHHCPMLLAALAAGKDVYAEKPLSKTLEESVTMINAVKKSDRVVQIGMQRRSSEPVMKAKKLIDDGILGQITLVKPQWHWNVAKPLNNTPLEGKIDWKRFLGSAQDREVVPMRFRYWRQFWDYAGGNMTDQGTHLMDVVQWFTNNSFPASAFAQGYVAKNIGAEHADVFSSVFEFPKLLVNWNLDYSNSYENGWSITFMGDKGTLIMEESGWRIYAEPWKRDAAPAYEEKPSIGVTNVVAHVQNFLDCVKSRKQPNCTVEMAARAVAGPHLANLSILQKKPASAPAGYLQS